MAKMSPEETYQKWANRLTNAVQDVKAGIDRVTESPTAKAAAAKDKWFAGIQRAHSSGKYVRGLQNVSLDDWKVKARDIGADRIPAGAAGAASKSTEFYAKLLPYEDKLKRQIDQMPSTTIQDSIARMTKWATEMSNFDRTK